MDGKMRLVAGMGTLDDYDAFCDAGADEIFVGFVPGEWQLDCGLDIPLNRREVCYYNVQLGSWSELEILSQMVNRRGIPVTIAVNGLYYREDLFYKIADMMRSCRDMGFSSFIVADPALLVFLHQADGMDGIRLHLSGESGEMNRFCLKAFHDLGIKRVIFHRQIAPAEMACMTKELADLEYEAFFLNERCQFHGAYCNSLHCDALPPACREPYRMGSFQGRDIPLSTVDNGDGFGSSGCGLCALWKLRDAGIRYLKIVGRGAYSENMIRDIRLAKQALSILQLSADEKEYCNTMKHTLFSENCSGNCYYRSCVDTGDCI